MNRPPPRTFTVLDKVTISPNMVRITLGGAGMDTFPEAQASAYIKLLFPRDGGQRPAVRTFTVRDQRADAIDVDFALHGDGGPAAEWARAVEPGATIEIAGPGPTKLVDPSADWFLFAGDMAALPAISANLERLPADARGYALLEVVSPDDERALEGPEGIEVRWLPNPQPGIETDGLADAVRALEWPEGRPAIWVACELTSMRKVRQHLEEERRVDPDDLYISSYWKRGLDEEHHKLAKRVDQARNGDQARHGDPSTRTPARAER